MASRLDHFVLGALIAVRLCAAQSTTYNPVAQSSLANALSSECVTAISVFPPTIASYASSICQLCQGLSITPSIEPCCSAGNPTACFASSLYGVSVSDATVTSPIDVPADLSSCSAAISIYTSCQAASPGFDNLCFHDQQSCYCSTSGTFAPSHYDNVWSNCLAYLSTANPSSYSLLGPDANGVVQSRPCQTWNELTQTGGTPSGCMTLAAATLSTPTSLAPVDHSSSAASQTSTPQNPLSTASTGAVERAFHIPAGMIIVVVTIVKIVIS